MGPIPFDPSTPDLGLLRGLVFRGLREHPQWQSLDQHWIKTALKNNVTLPSSPTANDEFDRVLLELFWSLVADAIIAPGINASGGQQNFPNFRLTAFGRVAVAETQFEPYDPTGYLDLLRLHVKEPDATVVAYLAESLHTFSARRFTAAAVMLGVAAERAFDLLCQSLLDALKSPNERQKFGERLARQSMKGKVQWVDQKLRSVQGEGLALPENTALMVTGIYDLLRMQRNELGHPRETPPRLQRLEVHSNLLMFPGYYATSEQVRATLRSNSV